MYANILQTTDMGVRGATASRLIYYGIAYLDAIQILLSQLQTHEFSKSLNPWTVTSSNG